MYDPTTSAHPVTQGEAGCADSTYRIVLPYGRPPLSANQRLNRWAKAVVVAQIRRDVAWLAVHHKIPHADRLTVQLHYAPGRHGRYDPMNLTATSKPAIDGLVDAKVVDDDDSTHVHEMTPEIHFPPESGPRCWLTIVAHNDNAGGADVARLA